MTGPSGISTGQRWRRLTFRRRWVLAVGLGLALVATGAWLVFSDVALPDERYSGAPDPCALVSTQTVLRLIGDAEGIRDDPDEPALFRRPSSRPEEKVRCRWQADPAEEPWNTIEVRANVYFGSKFGVGRSGTDMAEDLFTGCSSQRGKVYESDERGRVCAYDIGPPLPSLSLGILHENLFAAISVRPAEPSPLAEEPPWDPGEAAARLAEEVLSRLDRA